MSSKNKGVRGVALAVLAAGAVLGAAGAAGAGECPADKVVADGQGAQPVATGAEGVVDSVLARVLLAGEVGGLEDRTLRLRRLVIQPGGIVPWHSHTDRPAIIHVLEGTVIEHRSTCAVSIVHEAGSVAIETKGLSHWWTNATQKPAVLTSSDIFHEATEADPRMM